MLIKHKDKDISNLVGQVTWSGSRLQVARKLVFTYVQDDRDPNIPNYPINNGETVRGYDEQNNLMFVGNVYCVEKDTSSSMTTITAYDHLYVLTKSKTTRKFVGMKADAITTSICKELGVKPGKLAAPAATTSFIAEKKTGYQIIMMAYTEASKQSGKKYHPVMNGDALDVVERGTMIAEFEANDALNTENSKFEESIENMINQVMVVDEKGNMSYCQRDDDSIKKYSMFQDVYKLSPKEDNPSAIKKILEKSKPDRSGTWDVLGNYKVRAPYSIKVVGSLFTGKFWIKSDSHTFENGIHEMKLEAEFEELMNEEKVSDSEKKV